ncbi:FAD synthetase [Gaeumannomyces tritici R3-111a-1]|uniref:FAD synthase n=1 Tax=Gaeumannomyces tritici (strain R3-111a-1) TaxID=644352 RepID=J3NQ51_GAET3|nr:FAD synthetase [Gaeumannomyces tritici R3-111a-1]EJT78307.1 FAD synthetase [Gaeumannomyces tritici R3-111a-1]
MATDPPPQPGQPPLANGVAGKKAAAANESGATKPTGALTRNGDAGADADADADADPGSLRRVCLDAQRKVAAFLAEDPATEQLRALQGQVHTSLGVIDKALEDYRPEELSISYNGGKDCLVMLILILACLPRHFAAPEQAAATPCAPRSPSADDSATPPAQSATSTSTPPRQQQQPPPQPPQQKQPPANSNSNGNGTADALPPFPDTLQAVYVVSRHPFAEVDEFVGRTGAQYRLSVERVAQSMRPALHAYLASRPAVRAVFVGTRRTDPHGQDLTHFDPTDPGWPPFVRVHPVIDWHYAEIWAFIRHLGIPYCVLYDRGYTSLGGTTDTTPNPALKRAGAGASETFRPAYELMADNEERLGRDR